MSFLKRAAAGANGQSPGVVGSVAGVGDHWPAVAEFLTAAKWDDGKPREPGTVMILCEGGVWKAWLHDRANKRSAWLSGETAVALMAAVEDALVEDRVGWRADRK